MLKIKLQNENRNLPQCICYLAITKYIVVNFYLAVVNNGTVRLHRYDFKQLKQSNVATTYVQHLEQTLLKEDTFAEASLEDCHRSSHQRRL